MTAVGEFFEAIVALRSTRGFVLVIAGSIRSAASLDITGQRRQSMTKTIF